MAKELYSISGAETLGENTYVAVRKEGRKARRSQIVHHPDHLWHKYGVGRRKDRSRVETVLVELIAQSRLPVVLGDS